MKSIFLLMFLCTSCNALQDHDLIMLKYANTNTGSKFLEIDGALIHYRIQGSGPVIVLLPGTTDTLHSYELVVDKLKSRYTLVSFDLPGFGFSESFKYSQDFLADINSRVHKLLTKLELREYNLVGNSLGGLVAWSYALTYPKNVKKIILLDPAAYPQKIPWFFDTENLANKYIGEIIINYIPLEYILKVYAKLSDDLFGPPMNEPFMNLQFVRLSEIFQTKTNKKKYFETLKLFQYYKFSDSSKIKNLNSKNTLLIYGEYDKVIPYKDQLIHWKKDIPGVQVHIREGGGHLPHWEDPEKISSLIDDFISN